MRHVGFTLIELVVASALAVTLLVGLMGLVAGTGVVAADESREEGVDLNALHRVIAFDLTHARQFRPTRAGIELMGYGGIDPVSLAPDHRPVAVGYEVRTIARRSWLVRLQRRLDEPSTNATRVETVAPGVTALRWVGARVRDEEAAPSFDEKWLPVGDRIVLRLVTTRDGDATSHLMELEAAMPQARP